MASTKNATQFIKKDGGGMESEFCEWNVADKLRKAEEYLQMSQDKQEKDSLAMQSK